MQIETSAILAAAMAVAQQELAITLSAVTPAPVTLDTRGMDTHAQVMLHPLYRYEF